MFGKIPQKVCNTLLRCHHLNYQTTLRKRNTRPLKVRLLNRPSPEDRNSWQKKNPRTRRVFSTKRRNPSLGRNPISWREHDLARNASPVGIFGRTLLTVCNYRPQSM